MLSVRRLICPLAALAGLAAALPAADNYCKPRTICIDALNKCGVKWGGCYDTCGPTKPTAPPCPATTTSKSPCSATETICVDYVNECGMGYGGHSSAPTILTVGRCFPNTTPWPTFSKPSCPLTTSKPSITTTTSTASDNCSSRTVCADYINECGQWYGGCFPDCKPWPTFSKPPCPSSTTTSKPSVITSPPSSDNCSTRTACWDGINECGQTYGGCFPDCKPYPTFLPPPCTPTTTKPLVTTITPPPSTSNCSSQTVCWDGINECGKTYGGCFPDCKPWPTFTPPPCP